MKNSKKRFRLWAYILFAAIFVVTVFIACVNLISVRYESYTVNAGEVAVFTMNLDLRPIEDRTFSRLVIGFCCPNIWDPREDGNLRIWYESDLYPGEWKEMEMIPPDVMTVQNPITWADMLQSRYRHGTNVLSDMIWVPFWSVEQIQPRNNQWFTARVRIEARTSRHNLRAKLGFYVGHTQEGGTFSGDHQKDSWGETGGGVACFEVINGYGDLIDFCEVQANMNEPLSATQNDIVTIRYNAGLVDNDTFFKDKDGKPIEDEIYLKAIAYTDKGMTYAKTDLNEETKMTLGLTANLSYQHTFWPVRYFGIPDGEEIQYIEYVFSNQDGKELLKQTEIDGELIDEFNPFRYTFECGR